MDDPHKFEDISALHEPRMKRDLSDGNLRLDVHHTNLPKSISSVPHGLQDFTCHLNHGTSVGILCPAGTTVEPVAHANTLVLPAIDVHIVAAGKGDLVVRLLSRDQPHLIWHSLVQTNPETIDRT